MVSLIYNVLIFAIQSQGPPAPSQNRGPQLPIDENIWVLIAVGVLFGAYVIYIRTRSKYKAA